MRRHSRFRLISVIETLRVFAGPLVPLLVLTGAALSSTLLAEPAAILTAPKKLHAGGKSAFTLTLFDSVTHLPLTRQATVRLNASDGSGSVVLFSDLIEGRQRVEFDVPPAAAGSQLLSAQVSGIAEVLQIEANVDRAPAILIETDKPIYKPSQRIQGRVVLLNSRLRPVEDPVDITIHDAKGIRIARFSLTSDRFGVAPFGLDLANELNLGTWKIRARSRGAETVRDLRVEEYILPRFEILTEFEKSWALVDEPVRGSIESRYFFGRPVQGRARIRAQRWIGTWQEYASLEGPLSNGRWDFEIPPVGFVTGTVAGSGQGTIILEASVVDATGQEQSTSEVFTITQAPVIVVLVPATKVLKPGIPTPIQVLTETPEGLPLDQQVSVVIRFYTWNEILLESRQLNLQSRNGSAALLLDAPRDAAYAWITASALRDGRRTEVETYLGNAYSPSRSFLSLTRVGSEPVTIGNDVTFSTASTESGTVYYEVFGGGRTLLSDATEGETFSFPVTPDMVPRAKVVAYRMSSSNEIAADSFSFSVGLPITASLAAEFDAEQVRPGDPVEVILDAGTQSPTLLGVSIVDQSVLALGRSRLHLASVFEELERRFLEPQIEIHEGDGPEVPQFEFSADSPGALDVLNRAGLEVATTQNLMVPGGQQWDFRGLGPPLNVSPPVASEGIGPAQIPPRLRQFFPETWVWEPTLLTDENGRARLTLTAPDSITGWNLAVVATTADPPGTDPGIAFGEADLTVFQEFFVEPSLPYSVVRGETFEVKADVFNYLDTPQRIELKLEGSEGFEIVSGDRLAETVAANSTRSVRFLIRPGRVGEFPLQINALGEYASDAVLRPLRVVPEGLPVESVVNGVLQPGSTVPLTVPSLPGVVEGSLRSFLFLSASPVAQSMKGVSDLLEVPYGCGEQNMIFLAPDIEILKYLREIGELAPEIRAEAEHFVNVGYQRQLTYRSGDRGFSAFGGPHGSLWLTAFVLSTFSEAREVRDIDEGVLTGAASMLMSRQRSDGSFETDDFLIHKEMDGGIENLFAMTAYVAKALAEYGGTETAGALAGAAGYLVNNLSPVWEDPYALSIGAVALQSVPGFVDTAETLIDRLLELAVRDGVGIHWRPYPVETTGYAAIAMLASTAPGGRPEAQGAIEWLTTRRNSLGGYGNSTQDTVVAFRALFTAARKLNRELEVELTLLKGSQVLHTVAVNASNFDLLQQIELGSDPGPYDLRSAGTGSVTYQWVQRYNVPGQLLPPSTNMLLEVVYGTDHVEVDDILDVEVTVHYTGEKPETGMVIIDVGVPTGFEVVTRSLDELRSGGTVSRVEVAGRKVIFYLDGLYRDQRLSFIFQVKALFPVRAEGPVSSAYEYYDASVRAYNAQDDFVVLGSAPQISSLSTPVLVPGESILIRGSGFASGPLSVFVGDHRLGSFEVIDDSTLVITVPRIPPGDVELRVGSGSGSTTWEGSPTLRIAPPVLYFPLYPRLPRGFTGFAVVNHSDATARLDFEMRTHGGNRPDGARNPATVNLSAGRQMALLGEEIFGAPAPSEPVWVELRSDNPGVSGYSLFGTDRELDNLGGIPAAARRLLFTHLLQGPEAFQGKRAELLMALANPSSRPATLLLTLRGRVGATGQGFHSSRFRDLPAWGQIEGDLVHWFGQVPANLRDAFATVEVVQGDGVTGYQILRFPDHATSIGLPPQEAAPVRVLYAPQVAHTAGVRTTINLVNSTTEARTVHLSFRGPQGGEQAARRTVQLEPGQAYRDDLGAIFLLAEDASLEGYLVVESSGPGVVGDIFVADPAGLRFATGYPLQWKRASVLVLSQVANGAGIFTGLAILNPGNSTEQVTVEIRAADGTVVGSATFDLAAGNRLARLLPELVPESAGLVGGYVTVRSSGRLLVVEILGDTHFEHFSIVEPAEVE